MHDLAGPGGDDLRAQNLAIAPVDDLDESAQILVGNGAVEVVRPPTADSSASAQRAQPLSDGRPNGGWRILLEVVDACDRDLLLPRPTATEVHYRTLAENRSWLAFDKSLR